jgi:hypothetical protein
MREHLDALINKAVSYGAIAAASVGGANGVMNRVPDEVDLSIAEWGGIVGIAGGIVLIIERLYNIYTKWQDRRGE